MVFKLCAAKKHLAYRDSGNGRPVTEKYAKQHSKTTEKESIPNPGRGDTDRNSKK